MILNIYWGVNLLAALAPPATALIDTQMLHIPDTLGASLSSTGWPYVATRGHMCPVRGHMCLPWVPASAPQAGYVATRGHMCPSVLNVIIRCRVICYRNAFA